MIRLATNSDTVRIRSIRDQASRRMAAQGIDQWQHGEPTDASLDEDIRLQRLYVVEHDGIVEAMACLMHSPDENYAQIMGKWQTPETYLAIHRLAVADHALKQGHATALAQFAFTKAQEWGISAIRVDTHKDNKTAQAAFQRWGFKAAGVIRLHQTKRDPWRLAYERWVLPQREENQ